MSRTRTPYKELTVVFGVRLKEETAKYYRKRAESECRSAANVLSIILEDAYLAETRATQPQRTQASNQ